MGRIQVISDYELHQESIGFDVKKHCIMRSFDGDGILSFERLLSNCQNKLEVIVTFLAILDLIRLFEILVYQNELFNDFEIHRLEKN